MWIWNLTVSLILKNIRLSLADEQCIFYENSYATYQIKKRKNRFGLFVKTKRYTTQGEIYENKFFEDGYECVQSQIVLTNSSAKVLKTQEKPGKFIVINDFLPSKPVSTFKL